MEMLSDRYGWTPRQIREQYVEDIEQYMRIIGIKKREGNKQGKQR